MFDGWPLSQPVFDRPLWYQYLTLGSSSFAEASGPALKFGHGFQSLLVGKSLMAAGSGRGAR
jgi:hypothetical protein